MQQSNNTALFVMDIQAGIIGRISDPKALLSNTAKAIAYARSKNIPVIYVVVGLRQGAPEISMNNKSFSSFKEPLSKVDMNEYTKVHADVAPQPGEIIVTKRRISAFTGSDLEVVLRAYGIQHMVLCGISTSGVVLSTLREAADKDYRLTVLTDCCADADEEVHRVLTTKVFPRQAEVLSVEDWIKG